MLVESMMIRDVITLSPQHTLHEALKISETKRIRHLPVVDADGCVVGILSDRDLRSATPSTLTEGDHEAVLNTTVENIMIRDVITCHPLDFVEDAAAQMYLRRVGSLPVISHDQLVGIITERDILHTLVEMMGVNAPTSRVEVIVPDRPGMLANIADLLRARRINASTVMVFPSNQEGHKSIVFRIGTMDPRRFLQDIQNAGYHVVQPPSALDEASEV
ncbi:MAG: CBS and ACT domain-containing protein [Tumebacillaceae bacterium]